MSNSNDEGSSSSSDAGQDSTKGSPPCALPTEDSSSSSDVDGTESDSSSSSSSDGELAPDDFAQRSWTLMVRCRVEARGWFAVRRTAKDPFPEIRFLLAFITIFGSEGGDKNE